MSLKVIVKNISQSFRFIHVFIISRFVDVLRSNFINAFKIKAFKLRIGAVQQFDSLKETKNVHEPLLFLSIKTLLSDVLVLLTVHNQREHRHAPPSRPSAVPGFSSSAWKAERGSGRDAGCPGSCAQREAYGLVASALPFVTLHRKMTPPSIPP